MTKQEERNIANNILKIRLAQSILVNKISETHRVDAIINAMIDFKHLDLTTLSRKCLKCKTELMEISDNYGGHCKKCANLILQNY